MKELVELKARAAERRNRPDYARGVHLSDAHCVEAEDDVDELIAMVKEWEHLYLSTVPTMNELGKQRDQARAALAKRTIEHDVMVEAANEALDDLEKARADVLTANQRHLAGHDMRVRIADENMMLIAERDVAVTERDQARNDAESWRAKFQDALNSVGEARADVLKLRDAMGPVHSPRSTQREVCPGCKALADTESYEQFR